MRQSILAVCAMLLVIAVAAFEDFRSKDTVPKVRLSGTVTQLTTMDRAGGDPSLRFQLGSFPFELDIDASELSPLAKQGVQHPFNVGSRVDAIVAKSAVAAYEDSAPDTQARAAPIPVLALRVEGQPILGTSDAFRIAPSMRTWPHLLLVSAFGAALLFLGRKHQRRRSRRTQ